MSTQPFPPAHYIHTQDELIRLVERLQKEKLVGIDTESNSLYAYKEKVCLIQLSTRTADYIVDPLVIRHLEPLAPVMASSSIEKVFHAAEYDVMCMKRDFGFEFRNLFDTMQAARILGYKSIGLGSLLEAMLSVRLDKSHQRDDWGRRPLSPESLQYAQTDTHYLPVLRDRFHSHLDAGGHLDEAREIFDELCALPPAADRSADPEGFWRMSQPGFLNRQQMAVLRELYLLREEIAQERDVPAFKVFGNKTLLELARCMPRRQDELRSADGMTAQQIRRYGARVLKAVASGRTNHNLPAPPRHQPPDPVVTERYNALHTWRRDRAAKRGVESDIIISRQVLWDLALKAPTCIEELEAIRGMGPWRLKAYGQEILTVLSEFSGTLEG